MRWKNTETPTFAGSAGSSGKPAVVETMQLLDDDGNECAVFTKAVDGAKTASVGGVKVYRALLTQTGTNAPVATVLENSLGGTVVWTRSSGGSYVATFSGAFPADKVVGCSGMTLGEDGSYFTISRSDDNTLALSTMQSGGDGTFSFADAVLASGVPIEILVYP